MECRFVVTKKGIVIPKNKIEKKEIKLINDMGLVFTRKQYIKKK